MVEQFRDAIRSAGLEPPDMIEADGKLRRFASNGKRGDDAGWYILHGDGIPTGTFGDWRTGVKQTWRADIGREFTPAEEAAHRAKVEAMRRERDAEEDQRLDDAKGKALDIWSKARPAPDDYPYLTQKHVKAHGARLHNDALIIPIRDGSELHSLQFIDANGAKRFLTGGRVAGCYFSIGNPKGTAALCIAEGYATAATIFETTNYPVAAAFNCGNLEAVARALHAKFSDSTLILCADDDAAIEGNPGLTKARAAALAVGGKLAIPDFGDGRPPGASDFNDMATICGAEAVKHAIDGASEVNQEGDSQRPDWPEPLPLVTKVEPEPYPSDALPAPVRAAVIEVEAFVKAPLPLIATSALSALSLACQAHIDVRRDEILVGPAGLFLLSIAESGERKTQADKMFLHAVVDYQDQQRDAAKPINKRTGRR